MCLVPGRSISTSGEARADDHSAWGTEPTPCLESRDGRHHLWIGGPTAIQVQETGCGARDKGAKVQEAGCGAGVNATMLPVPILYTRINAVIEDVSEIGKT